MTALTPLETKSLSLRALKAEAIPDQEDVTAKTARTFGALRISSPFFSSRLLRTVDKRTNKRSPLPHRTRVNSEFGGP
jgi:hypothetical protein